MPGRRAIVLVLDGLGAGDAPDAAAFGDEGANTLANTARAVGGLKAPNLERLGLGNTTQIEGVPPTDEPGGLWGLMVEKSAAKATLAGHWEMMGLILEDPLPTYPEGFPEEIVSRFERETGRGVIGNKPASGTEILEELAEEQRASGDWILYTSADSVFQVAANTEVIPLEELYAACEKAHRMLIGEGEIKVERVIARPYHGSPGAYEREHENRHDYGIEPFGETYLNRIEAAGHEVVAVGKIRDIFDGSGITRHLPAPPDDAAKVDAVLQTLETLESGFVFANLVDFDAKFGHRRNPQGMAQNIESFDRRLPELLAALSEEDLLILTADHGNDPTFRGTDHTRERVPLLVVGSGTGEVGVRDGFSDLGASVCAWLGVERGALPGKSFLPG
ncbi:deoB: phosphopentomutase [Rubrobacter radiotolerans]|uniref:Phosphopentomutase n=1 Tax=Rubrobacter radiotolerans TaxID=42256 RepID=A0A023X5C2_RUBRA|nr:phosphopentomutase [Rubrobacter radiotolerans]AHY47523.1 deoB: phosphopentomutase [Rubrobacter radiotolerans]MDX5894926.1 phosphopentomutase [Rubrobacter radiotolerans]SMC07084.1 phosphopentomutase [Rubrobacter radiotolerans DSM 5868]